MRVHLPYEIVKAVNARACLELQDCPEIPSLTINMQVTLTRGRMLNMLTGHRTS